MLLDGYLHKSMLAGTPPEAGVHGTRLAQRSATQLARQVSRAVRCRSYRPPEPAIADAWNRQAELTDTLFDLAGWDCRDFVGYRCDERSPVWARRTT